MQGGFMASIWKVTCNTCKCSTRVVKVITVATERLNFPEPIICPYQHSIGIVVIPRLYTLRAENLLNIQVSRLEDPHIIPGLYLMGHQLRAGYLKYHPLHHQEKSPTQHLLMHRILWASPKGKPTKQVLSMELFGLPSQGAIGTRKNRLTLSFPFLTNRLRFLFKTVLTLDSTAHFPFPNNFIYVGYSHVVNPANTKINILNTSQSFA